MLDLGVTLLLCGGPSTNLGDGQAQPVFHFGLRCRSERLARTRLFHPWGHAPLGGGQVPAFHVLRCRTRPLLSQC